MCIKTSTASKSVVKYLIEVSIFTGNIAADKLVKGS